MKKIISAAAALLVMTVLITGCGRTAPRIPRYRQSGTTVFSGGIAAVRKEDRIALTAQRIRLRTMKGKTSMRNPHRDYGES